MTGILLKKQLAEIFRSYFYDSKKNRMRSKFAVIVLFALYALLMVGIMGGMFTFLSVTLCEALTSVGMGYLYFVILSGISILLGAFGSVFSTYSSLYLAKDNDLLLSMPIPVGSIIASRLLNVYLMGLLYSSVVIIPAIAVYIVTVGFTVTRLLCGIALAVIISLTVMVMSCFLGLCVARISLKLKNKSYITVIIALVFIAAYYFFYFKASELMQDLIANAVGYGEKLRTASQALYMFGRIGEGDIKAALIYLASVIVLMGLTWCLLSRSFLSIATSTGSSGKKLYRSKKVRAKSQFASLLSKEFGRFTSSANYMLNCGLSTLFIPICGIMLLIKGNDIAVILTSLFDGHTGAIYVLIAAALCMLTSMNDMAAPSLSLEGKSFWIVRSLPVDMRELLRAKMAVQLLLTVIPMLFTCVCACIVLKGTAAEMLLMCLVPLTYCPLSAVFNMFLGTKMANLNWTNEITPIKQSACVAIAIFGSWLYSFAAGGLYFLIGYEFSPVIYLAPVTVINCAACAGLYAWLMASANRILSEL